MNQKEKKNTIMDCEWEEECCRKVLSGPQGDIGFQGRLVHGPQGPIGFESDVVIIGNQGSQGFEGFMTFGPQGLAGIQGPLSSFGSQGAQGRAGFSNNGPQGFDGHVGVQGPQSDIGHQGWKGTQGSLSDVGQQGPQGHSGFQGIGNSGPSGPPGPNATSTANVTSLQGSVALVPSSGWTSFVPSALTGPGTYAVFFDGTFKNQDLTGGNYAFRLGGTSTQITLTNNQAWFMPVSLQSLVTITTATNIGPQIGGSINLITIDFVVQIIQIM